MQIERSAPARDIAERDRIDSTRAVAPLKPAPDAVTINTDGITAEQVTDRLAAIIAARQLIVEGAVGMVRMALDKLQSEGVVTLSDSDRVKLTCNLLTVLVSESETQPVLSVARGEG